MTVVKTVDKRAYRLADVCIILTKRWYNAEQSEYREKANSGSMGLGRSVFAKGKKVQQAQKKKNRK